MDLDGNLIKYDPGHIYWEIMVICGIIILLLNVATYVQVRKYSEEVFKKIKDINLDAGMKILEKERNLGKMVNYYCIVFNYTMIIGDRGKVRSG